MIFWGNLGLAKAEFKVDANFCPFFLDNCQSSFLVLSLPFPQHLRYGVADAACERSVPVNALCLAQSRSAELVAVLVRAELLAVPPRRLFAQSLLAATCTPHLSSSPLNSLSATAARRRTSPPQPLLAAAPRRRSSQPSPLLARLLAADPCRCKGLPPLIATAPSACCIYGCKLLRHPPLRAQPHAHARQGSLSLALGGKTLNPPVYL
jgi:hypothetical protein